MHLSISSSEFVAAEQRRLKRYGWLFLLFGIPAGWAIDGVFWTAITLDPAYLPSSLGAWFTRKGFFLGGVIALLPLFWMAGIWVEKKWGETMRRCAVIPVLVVVACLMAEWGFRSFPAQDLLWQSVRARAGFDYFAREISLLRLDEASRKHYGDKTPGVVVAGSSQIMYALDAVRMQELINQPVFRRAAAGMFTAEMCSASGFMDFNPYNVFIMMLSGLDVGARPQLNTDGMRPLATPGGVGDLMTAATPSYLLRNWRTFTDLSFASWCDMWRSRDYVRLVYANPFRPKQNAAAKSQDDDAAETQRAALQQLGRNPEALAYGMRILDVFLDRAHRSFHRVVVVEGRVNPKFPGQAFEELTAQTRAMMLELEARDRIDYITLDEQAITLTEDDWLDMTHVQGNGRRLYTEMFSRVVRDTN